MPSIIVKNTKGQHLQWRNVTFPANGEIPVDVVLFNKLVHEFVPIYGKCGLVWDENEFQKLLQKLHPPERFRLIKIIGRWLKDQVLARVIIGVIVTILTTALVFYINQWLGQHQEKSPPQSQSAKVTPE
ncbi:hypothetical protein [Acidithiobacillus ferrivorans]|uniref:Uncharacterized protein n=1 Tax=Acidithiobacillus ferrivorans TaxID=160808 RepID=A0A7T5BGU7_9PROT|nr:hypothetical protein [Acidithiobacillus ferrivorans]QQD71933.1 hypothetical protein H2515_10900 [Acidithiobacillus ferrivorans]